MQALDDETHTTWRSGHRMTKSRGHAGLWQILGAILSLLAKGIGAGLSSIATMTFGGRTAPGDLPTSPPPKEYRP